MEFLKFSELPTHIQMGLNSQEIEKIKKSIKDMGLTFTNVESNGKHSLESYINEKLEQDLHSKLFIKNSNVFYLLEKVGIQ